MHLKSLLDPVASAEGYKVHFKRRVDCTKKIWGVTTMIEKVLEQQASRSVHRICHVKTCG